MKTDKKLWPAVVIRIFAAINVLMGIAGLLALWSSVRTTLRYDLWSKDPPFYAQAYYIRCGINLAFVVLTILSGVYLWPLGRRGWTLCKLLFFGQIAYFLLEWLQYPLGRAVGARGLVSRALAATEGTGNMGIVFQTLTGYPVIALVLLKLAYRRLPGGTSSPPGTTPPSS